MLEGVSEEARHVWSRRLDPDSWPGWVRAGAAVALVVGALVLVVFGPEPASRLLH
jgi:hypothetical protein